MFKNHFKIALRNLIRSRFSSTIKIGGLSAGMTVAMLIGLWISDELSFNKCFKNYDRIALVMRHETWEGVRNTLKNNTIPMGTELRSAYAEDFTQKAVRLVMVVKV
jgi:hypothetical protein